MGRLMPGILQGKKIILGVTGGIAAYKAVELLRLLVSAGSRVQVVMTRGAQEFVTPLTFHALSGEPVRTGLFGPDADPLEHISLAQEVDALIIAPATANCIGKMAAGIGDDLLTTLVLAATRPILVCPAMNVKMYENPVVLDNLARLNGRGFHIMAPEVGEMACGAYGSGRHCRGPGDALVTQGFTGLSNSGERRSHSRRSGSGAVSDEPVHRQNGLRRGENGPAAGCGGLPGQRPLDFGGSFGC
jgi:phosphopantothenoylcysteine synthetase/decarboxylase